MTLLLSVLVHLAFWLLAEMGYIAFKPALPEVASHTYQIQLKGVKQEPDPSEEVVPETDKVKKQPSENDQPKKEKAEEPAPPEKVPLEPEKQEPDKLEETPPESESVNPIHNSEINASSNQTEKKDAQIIPGKRDLEEAKSHHPNPKTRGDPLSPGEDVPEPETDITKPIPEAREDQTPPQETKGFGANSSGAATSKARETAKSKEKKENADNDSMRTRSAPKVVTTSNESDFTLEDAPISEKRSEEGGPNGAAAFTDNRGRKGESSAEGDKDAVQPGRTAESPKPSEEPKIPAKFLEKFGNLDILDDGEMRATKIEEPLSEIESKTIQMVNRYLARMQKQVEKFYRKPKKEMNRLQGIIRFELDPAGYLQDAYIFIGSGDAELDMAALDAVRSVVRYEVPENRILAERYYSVLNFYYSSEDNKVDQAPWEDKKKEGSPQ